MVHEKDNLCSLQLSKKTVMLFPDGFSVLFFLQLAKSDLLQS